MLKKCLACNNTMNRHPSAKYCEECAEKTRVQRERKTGADFRKRKQARKKYQADYNADCKKLKVESTSRLDQKSFWDDRDTSCDGSQYF